MNLSDLLTIRHNFGFCPQQSVIVVTFALRRDVVLNIVSRFRLPFMGDGVVA